jgi:membrane glycosyltransferase
MSRSNRRTVFVGMARDCAHHLAGVLANLESFAGTVSASSFLFVVSDSRDESRTLLESWLSHGRHGSVAALGSLAETFPRRTERLAHVRNVALDCLVRRGWSNHDQLVVLDLDDVMG